MVIIGVGKKNLSDVFYFKTKTTYTADAITLKLKLPIRRLFIISFSDAE